MNLFERLYTTLYRRVWLVSKDLQQDTGQAAESTGLKMGFLEPAMLADYEAFRPGKRRIAVERMAAGHRAILVWDGPRIAGCVWAGTGRAYISYLDRDIVLRAREMYTFDAFTHPAFRRLGIATARNRFLTPYYRGLGYERAAGVVAFENHAGIRSAEAAGYRREGVFTCVRLGFTQIDFLDRSMDRQLFAPPLNRLGG